MISRIIRLDEKGKVESILIFKPDVMKTICDPFAKQYRWKDYHVDDYAADKSFWKMRPKDYE